MFDTIETVTRKAARRPGKTALQAAVIAAGAMAFSAGLSISGSISDLERQTFRYRVAVAAGETDEDGRFRYTMPPPFTQDVLDSLVAETGWLKAAAPVNEVRWNAIRVGGSRFSIRSVLAAGADYPAIMGLELAAGRTFTDEESDSGSRLALVSRSVAETLFGTAEAAVSSMVETERGIMVARQAQGGARQSRVSTERLEIVGVYETPTEVARTALGIPDAIVPVNAWRMPGMSGSVPIRTFVAETDGTSPAALEARLSDALFALGAGDVAVEAWEGDPSTPNATAAAEARTVLTSLSGAIMGLGLLILAASVFGIYSGTAMDAADGRKGTAIRRALGESAGGTVARFAATGAALGAVAAVIGAVVSIPAYRALAMAAESVLAGAGLTDAGIFPLLPPWWAPVVAVAVTAGACALFALAPSISASRAGIVEGIQEL